MKRFYETSGQSKMLCTLENADVRVVFYQSETTNGTVKKNEMYVKCEDTWLCTKRREEPLYVTVLRADNAKVKVGKDLPWSKDLTRDIYHFSTSYQKDGRKTDYE